MNIRITSWNTFGSSISKLSEVSGKLISKNRKDILLIQEAGTQDSEGNQLIDEMDITIGTKNFKCFFKDDLNADNKRCTTGILVEQDLYNNAAVTFSSLDLGGIRRPVVFCTLQPDGYPPLYIATIHATARNRISRTEIEKINNHFSRLGKSLDWQWILMGDFNVSPQNLMQTNVPGKNIIYPSGITHVGTTNEVLDYAVVSDAFVDSLKIHLGEYSGTSDHIPVYCELNVNEK